MIGLHLAEVGLPAVPLARVRRPLPHRLGRPLDHDLGGRPHPSGYGWIGIPWSCSRMPSSYAAPPGTTSSDAGSPAPAHAQAHVRDRAVHGVVLRAVRVRVHPADEALGAAPTRVPRTCTPLPESLNVQWVGASVTSHLAQREAVAGHAERAVADPRRRDRPHLHPADGRVEPVAVLGQPVQPDPALGVLRAPVVARHAAPAVDRDLAPLHHEPARRSAPPAPARAASCAAAAHGTSSRAGGGRAAPRRPRARAPRRRRRRSGRSAPSAPDARLPHSQPVRPPLAGSGAVSFAAAARSARTA